MRGAAWRITLSSHGHMQMASAENPQGALCTEVSGDGKYICRHCHKRFKELLLLKAHCWGGPFAGRSRSDGLRKKDSKAKGGTHSCFKDCCRFPFQGPVHGQGVSDYLAQLQGAPDAVAPPPPLALKRETDPPRDLNSRA